MTRELNSSSRRPAIGDPEAGLRSSGLGLRPETKKALEKIAEKNYQKALEKIAEKNYRTAAAEARMGSRSM